jgi:hypothetical protein
VPGRLFNFAAVVSLLTFFAGIGVFASCREQPLVLGNRTKWCSIQAMKENFTIETSWSAAPDGPLVFDIWQVPPGLTFIRTNNPPWGRSRNAWVYRVDMYYLLFIPATILLPTVRFRLIPLYAAWRSRQSQPGHCRACGYDLRATPDRCPECGTPVSPLVKVAK